jgi:hypothetical protein
VKLKIALENKKRPKRSQMAKLIFRGQARKKKAKFELFGLQEANLATLFNTLGENLSSEISPFSCYATKPKKSAIFGW